MGIGRVGMAAFYLLILKVRYPAVIRLQGLVLLVIVMNLIAVQYFAAIQRVTFSPP